MNTNDAGPGSLRQAILDSNASAGITDTIAFSVAGLGCSGSPAVCTIAPASALPTITDPVIIDATTQPGFAGSPLVVLQGTASITTGLSITTSDSTVKGLSIVGFSGNASSGLYFLSVSNNRIEGNWIGLDATGAVNGNFHGVTMSGSGNVVGGTTAAQRNVISGNGVGVFLQAASNNVIEGNFIGTDASGMMRRGNQRGVVVTESPNNVVGGTAPGARNVISGNDQDGVVVSLGFEGTFSNTVLGNYIGTDAAGTGPLGNMGAGVVIANGVGNTVGGSSPNAHNVISANGVGIHIYGPADIRVLGNLVGTDATGTLPLGNLSDGVVVEGPPLTNSAIGGTVSGEGNVIAFNGGGGVHDVDSSGVAIRGNAIYSNVDLGIKLGPTPPVHTANDPCDADSGPNGLQNFPTITAVTHGPSDTTVGGRLDGTANTLFNLDFFEDPICVMRPQGFIQGKTYLGTAPVTTDANCGATFSVVFPVVTTAQISATATDPNGNTSEFSPQHTVFSTLPNYGSPAGGTGTLIQGTDFQPGASVTIGGIPVAATVGNTTSINSNTPALPAGTVNAVAVLNPDGSGGTLANGWVADFLDVPPEQDFHFFIIPLVTNGVAVGFGDGTYGANTSATRAQMAVFLLKSKLGVCFAPPTATGTVFADVHVGDFAADWIEALAAAGITAGCAPAPPSGLPSYCPDMPITRAEMAVLLLKSEHGVAYVPPPCAGIFQDVECTPIPAFAVDWIERLYIEGITSGCLFSPPGLPSFCPDQPSTRGQVAKFMVKTFNLQ